jgi:hypothetical protein
MALNVISQSIVVLPTPRDARMGIGLCITGMRGRFAVAIVPKPKSGASQITICTDVVTARRVDPPPMLPLSSSVSERSNCARERSKCVSESNNSRGPNSNSVSERNKSVRARSKNVSA